MRDALEAVAEVALPRGGTGPASGCSWQRGYPGWGHGEPEWDAAGRCGCGHLERALLCARCKARLEGWMRADLKPPAPWCAHCYRARPGGHHCAMAVEFTPPGHAKPPC